MNRDGLGVGEPGFDGGAHGRDIGAADELWTQGVHHFAHVLNLSRAELGHRIGDQGRNFVRAEGHRQKFFNDLQFEALFVREVLALRGIELRGKERRENENALLHSGAAQLLALLDRGNAG